MVYLISLGSSFPIISVQPPKCPKRVSYSNIESLMHQKLKYNYLSHQQEKEKWNLASNIFTWALCLVIITSFSLVGQPQAHRTHPKNKIHHDDFEKFDNTTTANLTTKPPPRYAESPRYTVALPGLPVPRDPLRLRSWSRGSALEFGGHLNRLLTVSFAPFRWFPRRNISRSWRSGTWNLCLFRRRRWKLCCEYLDGKPNFAANALKLGERRVLMLYAVLSASTVIKAASFTVSGDCGDVLIEIQTRTCAWMRHGESQRVSIIESEDVSLDRWLCLRYVESISAVVWGKDGVECWKLASRRFFNFQQPQMRGQ